MEWLNYHHLLYFWTVAKEGSISKACEKLSLAQPTISGQLRTLEENLGEKLFSKVGRGLELTDTGRFVFQYAEEIFGIGRELQDALKGRPLGRPSRVRIGVSDLVSKMIAFQILQPILLSGRPAHLICHEDSTERLFAELGEHRIDAVICDTPITSQVSVKAFNHLLGSSAIALFGKARLAAQYRRNFPKSLANAPFLLPMEGCPLRRSLDQFFDANKIQPQIIGEFKDSALLKTFGQAGLGLFAAPTAIAREIKQRYAVSTLGELEDVVEQYYVVSVERRLRNPAIMALTESARNRLFG